MEEELKCPFCKQLFNSPVLLPCFHSLCLGCALELQVQNQQGGAISSNSSSSSSTSSASSTTSGPESVASDQDQSDKASILSEADSGVSCNISSSRPGSFAGTPSLLLQSNIPPSSCCVYSLLCPVCRKICLFDESGARNLPPYRAMESIIDRFCEREALRCQMCETEPKVATLICEQCEIRYCDPCRDLFHPTRGPLAKHNLTKPKGLVNSTKDSSCPEHSDSVGIFYCNTCKLATCQVCISENRHHSHDVQPISMQCKAQKTELSQNLQQLSEKARSTTEFIQRLKGMSDQVTDSTMEFERLVNAQCDTLIRAIEERRVHLLEVVKHHKELKIRALKEQQVSCTGKLQQTTGLIQFCIEALKEIDNAAFLQIGSMLISRVANTDVTWHKEVTNAAPRVSPQFDLTLDDLPVLQAIEKLNFIPTSIDKESQSLIAPVIIPEACAAENNSVTIAWRLQDPVFVEGFVLELNDGNGGEFREVYCGKETICTVDGLHFNSMYNARVKAFNHCGEGDYSEVICLQTAEVAWFTFDPLLSGQGLSFMNDNSSVVADGWEHMVALGSVGFSRGIHYWEYTVDKYAADTDPAFGIARIDVARDKMLGTDDKGYALYIDRKRSWFQHNAVHERRVEGGIQSGSTVGVLLDLNRHTLSFLVNGMPQGSVAFRDLYGVFYPAVSINRGVTLTLHTALHAPRMDY